MFLSKQLIVFECTLGEEVQKSIQLQNLLNQTVHYQVKIEGSNDYKLGDEHLQIEPKAVVKYYVKFVSRISDPQMAKIYFLPKKDSIQQPEIIVFELTSKIIGRVNDRIY